MGIFTDTIPNKIRNTSEKLGKRREKPSDIM
jgi:hypothetical protein